MIEELLPDDVAAVSRRSDGVVGQLFPEELKTVENAVDVRREEFATGRACAREALSMLGFPPQGIPTGYRGAPEWPTGTVGSITHCQGYRACAVARSDRFLGLGIDAEPNEPLKAGLLRDVALKQERVSVRELALCNPDLHWDRLLFSAKEAAYKVWFPLTKSWLGFDDAVVDFDRYQRQFVIRFLVPGPKVEGRRLGGLVGRWCMRDGVLLTAIVLAAESGSGPASPGMAPREE